MPPAVADNVAADRRVRLGGGIRRDQPLELTRSAARLKLGERRPGWEDIGIRIGHVIASRRRMVSERSSTSSGTPTVPSPRGSTSVSRRAASDSRRSACRRREPKGLPCVGQHRVGRGGQHVELLQLELALFERAFDLRQLGRVEDGLAVLLPRPVVALGELGQEHGQPVDFRVVPCAVGQDLGDAQPSGLLVEIMR